MGKAPRFTNDIPILTRQGFNSLILYFLGILLSKENEVLEGAT